MGSQALSGAATGGKPPKLGVWKPNMGIRTMLVSLGREDGVCRVGGCVCTGCLPSIKCKDLFVEKTRSEFKV
jgi:hypothetical protein